MTMRSTYARELARRTYARVLSPKSYARHVAYRPRIDALVFKTVRA